MLSERRSRPRPDTNLHHCGFVCTACSFQMRLFDLSLTHNVIGSFKAGAQTVNITCPECGEAQVYSNQDLKVFLPGGKQIHDGKHKSTSA